MYIHVYLSLTAQPMSPPVVIPILVGCTCATHSDFLTVSTARRAKLRRLVQGAEDVLQLAERTDAPETRVQVHKVLSQPLPLPIKPHQKLWPSWPLAYESCDPESQSRFCQLWLGWLVHCSTFLGNWRRALWSWWFPVPQLPGGHARRQLVLFLRGVAGRHHGAESP